MKSPAVREPQQRISSGDDSEKTAPSPLVTRLPRESAAGLLTSQSHWKPAPAGSRPRRVQVSKIAGLPPEQRAQVDHWLTVDQLGYEACAAKILSSFGVKVSRDSTFRYFHEHLSTADQTGNGAKPLVDVTISTMNATVRIAVMPSGEVITTKGEAK